MITCEVTIRNGKEAVLDIILGKAEINEIVNDLVFRLDEMISSDKISGGELLKIDGITSPALAAVTTEKLKNLYDAIALYNADLKVYIVAVTRTVTYTVGQVIAA